MKLYIHSKLQQYIRYKPWEEIIYWCPGFNGTMVEFGNWLVISLHTYSALSYSFNYLSMLESQLIHVS